MNRFSLYPLFYLIFTTMVSAVFGLSEASANQIAKNNRYSPFLQLAENKTSKSKKQKKAVQNTSNKKPIANKNQQNAPVNPNVIKSLTNELDILNKQLQPRLQQKSAVEHIQDRKYHKAINLLESLDDLSPRSLIILAEAYENNEDYENQLRVLRKLVRKDDKNGAYLLELAKAFKNLYFKTLLITHKEEAIKTIQTIYTLKKKYHEKADIQMLDLLKKDEKENKYSILKLLQKMIREYGPKSQYTKELCKYFYINEYYNKSQQGCKRAMEFFPKEPNNYIYYALSMEKPKDIEKHLLSASKKFPRSYLAQIKTGQFFIEQKEYKKALPYFKKLIKLYPKSAEAQLGRAQTLFFTRKEIKAYKHYFKACMLDKKDMIWPFRQAKSILNQKSKFKLASRYDRAITKCFLKAKLKKDL